MESHVLLGHGDRRTAAQAEQAAEAFSERDAPPQGVGDQAGAQCNLALILAKMGDLTGPANSSTKRWRSTVLERQ